jgi:hypothetical protein
MTETTYFFDGVAYTEGQQADFQASAMRPQGVFQESVLGTLAVTAVNGNMTVTLGAGEALVQGFYYRNDANKVLTIAANASGSLRVDRVVLRLDRAANSLLAVIKQGTPGAGIPALTQVTGGTWEFPLYTVVVPSGAVSIVSASLTDQRLYSKWPILALDAAVAGEATTRASADSALSARVSALETVTLRMAALVNGSTGGILNSVNVASVTHVSPGQYDIFLTTPLPHTAPFILGIVEMIGYSFSCVAYTVSQLHVICFNAASGGSFDANFSMMVYA